MLHMKGRRASKAALWRGGEGFWVFQHVLLLFTSFVSDSACYVWEAVVPVRLLCGGGGVASGCFSMFYHCFRLVFQIQYVTYGRSSWR